jgi:hypothetical protein
MSANSTYNGLTTCDDWICADCGVRRGLHRREAQALGCLKFARKAYDFAGMLRIKNEAERIAEVIESIKPLCGHIFILDDHSTDETAEICRSFGAGVATVFESPFSGMNESRDKNWLYDQIIKACAPEWILCVDGDEVLEKAGAAAIRRSCAEGAAPNAFALKIEFVWNDPGTVRTDRIYGDFWRPSLFRPQHEDPAVPDSRTLLKEFRFMSTPFGRAQNEDQPNLHCSSVPQRLLHGFKRLPARLKHYGYMEREQRVRKLDFYTSIDWKNAAEDWYRHMCQGDDPSLTELPRVRELVSRGLLTGTDVRWLLDVPAGARLVHAGPLRLEGWSERWSMSDWAVRQNI